MLVWEFQDMLDISQEDSYQIQELLTAQTSADDYDQDFSDYFSVGVEG